MLEMRGRGRRPEQRRRGSSHLVISLFLTATLLSSVRAAQAADINPVRFVTPNGMTVLVLEQHWLPIVQVHALIKAGAAQDPPEEAGLANLVASLLDEGTTTRTAKQLAEQIEFVGGTLTTKAEEDFTTASALVLKKDTELGFELLADILLHPTFPEQEVKRVRSQILGEMQSEKDDPGLVATKAFHQLVFDGHPYRWPVNGTEETVPKITQADIQNFFSHEYLPNQTILAIVGDIPVEQARALVAKQFGSWKRGTPPSRTVAKPAQIDKPVVRLIEKDLTQATIVLGHLGISRTNPDFYAVSVMNHILGAGGFSSRLMDSIRDRQGLVYGVGSHFEPNLMPGAFMVNLQTRNETANQAISGVLTELKSIRETPVTDQELADAKAYLIGSFPLRLDTTAKLAQVLSLVELYGLGLDYFSQYLRWIEKVTKEDVLRVAKQYLHPNRYALVVVGALAKAKVQP
ncbi:MAG: insulinase family protein [Nitrospirae bacterium]|nr:MAG: insulinase family protein [Nitrospirota bacterium]